MGFNSAEVICTGLSILAMFELAHTGCHIGKNAAGSLLSDLNNIVCV